MKPKEREYYIVGIPHPSLVCVNVKIYIKELNSISKTVFSGNYIEFENLVKKGTDINCPYKENGFTLLQIAILFGRDEFISLLLKHGAKPDKTSLIYVVLINNTEQLKQLVEHGADINAAIFSEDGENKLLYYADKNSEMEQLLIELGAVQFPNKES
jgi:ankyrin repeat protein